MQHDDAGDELLNTADAADVAKVDRSTFTRWVSAGRIDPVARGKGISGPMFFRRSDVERLAAARDAWVGRTEAVS